jgi:hypothetical protein
MNFLLSEGSSEGSDLGWLAEKNEASRESLDATGARDAYGKAEQLFSEAKAPRGLANVQLRSAWLSAVNDDFQSAAKQAESAACAEMHEALGDLPAALRSCDLAITSLEARRRLLTRDELKSALAADRSAQYLYFLAARAALKTGDRARALRYLENGKARALLDLMAATGARKPEPEPADDLLHRWRQLNAQLALTRGLLAQARNARQPNNDAVNDLTNRIAAEDEQLHQAEKHLTESHPPSRGFSPPRLA